MTCLCVSFVPMPYQPRIDTFDKPSRQNNVNRSIALLESDNINMTIDPRSDLSDVWDLFD